MPAAGTAQTSERWWCAVAASPVATSTVRSARGHGGDRLHRGADPQHLAGGHAALGAARPAADPADAVVGRTISSCASEPGRGGEREAVADLDALDRLDAHQRAGQPRVEPAVPVHVRAEARRQAVHDHLDDAAEGVAVLVRLVDPLDHRLARVGVEAAHRVVVEARHVVGLGPQAVGGAHAAELDDVRDDPGADGLLEEVARRPGPGRPGRRSRGRWRAPAPGGPRRSRTSACRPGRRGRAAGRVSGALRAGPRARPGRPGRPTSPSPTWATRCCRSGSRPGRPGSRRAGRRRRT